MRYELPYWLDDIEYPQAMKDWWREQTNTLNEDYDRLEALEKRDHNPIPEGYWWCPVHGKVKPIEASGEHRHCAHNMVTGPHVYCGRDITHRTDTDEYSPEAQESINRGLSQTEKIDRGSFADEKAKTMTDFYSKMESGMKTIDESLSPDELRCIDCGETIILEQVETEKSFLWKCMCSLNARDHVQGKTARRPVRAREHYRKLIDDRAIADRARAEDRGLNEDCTDYLTGWIDCASHIVYGGEG